MKKGYLYSIAFVVIFIIAILVGVILFNIMNPRNKKQEKNTIVDNTVISQRTQNTINNEVSIHTNAEEEKISPKASMILQKHYQECNHIIKQYEEIPEEVINMTQLEVKEKYPDWEIEKFSPLEVVLLKEEEGMCNKHYVLRENDKQIVIYSIDEQGEETLKEETGISTEYLTQTDLLKIKQGIKVYGEEQLNSALEDFE